MREHEQPIRFLVGSGSLEELKQKLLAEEAERAASSATPVDEGDVEFAQPRRPPKKR